MATYPVLPLTDAVLLPGMVIPVTLDSATQAAVDAARTRRRQHACSPCPASTASYGPVGTVAVIEQVGRLPSGEPAAVLRGLPRARIGSGVPGPGAALWVESTPFEEAEPTGRTRELAREYKSLITAELQRRGAWQVIDAVERMTDPAELADSAGYAPWLSLAQKAELLGATDVNARLELLVGWAREHIAELEVAEKISDDVREGLEKSQREFLLRQQLAAIRKELGEDEPDGAADYRTRVEQADLPENVREAALREVGRLERASDASPEAGWIRTWLDTVLELPWTRPDRGQHRPHRGPGGAGRRPRRPGRREGPDPGVPGGPQPARRPRPARRRRPRLRRGAGAGRPARRRQDQPRRVGRPGAGPQVRPGVAGRRPGRGRDPRPPAHLRRRAARPDRPGHPRGRLDEPGRAARRGRQARRGLSPATRPRPCSRCSTRRRTTRSATTTSRSTSTCPTCCSWPPPTSPTPSPARCWTGWRWSPSTATPRRRRSPSPATTCGRGSSSGPA